MRNISNKYIFCLYILVKEKVSNQKRVGGQSHENNKNSENVGASDFSSAVTSPVIE